MLTGYGECPFGSARQYKIIGEVVDVGEITPNTRILVREITTVYRPDGSYSPGFGELEIKTGIKEIKEE